jgi:hypothetical protein
MSSTRCVWIQYRNATGLELIGECGERPSESEVLIASQLGDGLDAEDLGEHLVVTLGETGQGRRPTVEDFLQSLVFVRPVQHLARSTDVAIACSLLDRVRPADTLLISIFSNSGCGTPDHARKELIMISVALMMPTGVTRLHESCCSR